MSGRGRRDHPRLLCHLNLILKLHLEASPRLLNKFTLAWLDLVKVPQMLRLSLIERIRHFGVFSEHSLVRNAAFWRHREQVTVKLLHLQLEL